MGIKVTFIIEDIADDYSITAGYPDNALNTKVVEYSDYCQWTSLMLDFADMLEGHGYCGVREKLLFVQCHGHTEPADRTYENIILKSDLELINNAQQRK